LERLDSRLRGNDEEQNAGKVLPLVPDATPIVHIGYPKTASTWFQRSFYPHVRAPAYVDRARVNAAFLDGNAYAFDPAQARETLGLGAGEAGIRFSAELHLDVDWASVSLAPRLQSSGLPLTYVARLFNLFTARSVLDKRHIIHLPGWYWTRRQLLEGMNRTRLFGVPPTLERLVGKETARWIADQFVADNRWLAEHRQLPLADRGYPMVLSGAVGVRPQASPLRRRLAS
jgi:hypothetical protein